MNEKTWKWVQREGLMKQKNLKNDAPQNSKKMSEQRYYLNLR